MLSFSNPLFLLALPAALLLPWIWDKRQQQAFRFPDIRLVRSLCGPSVRIVRWVTLGGRGAALGLIIVACAGPRLAHRGERIQTEGIAVEIVLDVSGSMAETNTGANGRPMSRLEAARQAIVHFLEGSVCPEGKQIEGRPDDLIGLVTFARWPQTACPLTLDHRALVHILEREEPKRWPGESQTNIGDALAWGLHRLQGVVSLRRTLVLITDGEHNVPRPALLPIEAARLAAAQGIPIYVIDVSEVHPGVGPAALANRHAATARGLADVAQTSGGRYFRAEGAETLYEVCRLIDQLNRRQISSPLYARYDPVFTACGLAALFIWAAIGVLSQTVWRLHPS